MTDAGIAIIGAGMAGYGAAHAFYKEGIRPRVYDLRSQSGGLTSSHSIDGFVFDEGVHISFTKNEKVKAVFQEAVEGAVENGHVYCNNYWKGHWIRHPAQVNLFGLPHDLIIRCIADFVEARQLDGSIRNYEDWLYSAFGKTFADTFPMKYTVKYHTTEAKNLTTDWLGPRVYRPSLEEVLAGALQKEPADFFYVNEFRYPSYGGFGAFLNQFHSLASLSMNHEVVRIDMKERKLYFRGNSSAEFNHLISSVPLPRLVPLIAGVPKDVLDASRRLACSQAVVVNIGIRRQVKARPQWSYFYDDDIPFARVSYRENLSPHNVPEGCSAFQAEIYFSEKYRPLSGEAADWIDPAIEGLLRCGLLQRRSEIVHRSSFWLPFANVIFDHDRPRALETIHSYLDDIGVGYCGRFGDWGYMWTDHAFLSGERAARSKLQNLR